MANIKNMEMAEALSQNSNITIKKAFLGLKQTVVYNPTQSPCTTYVLDYAPEVGERLERLLNMAADKMRAELAKGALKPVPIGNVRLEAVVSTDGQFAAVQLFRFTDFKYHNFTPLKTFEGEEAAVIVELLQQ